MNRRDLAESESASKTCGRHSLYVLEYVLEGKSVWRLGPNNLHNRWNNVAVRTCRGITCVSFARHCLYII